MKERCIRKKNSEKARHTKAQATIELTIAFIASILLLIGVTKIFVWMNKTMVDRQIDYQKTRTTPLEHLTHFKQKDGPWGPESPKLDIFDKY